MVDVPIATSVFREMFLAFSPILRGRCLELSLWVVQDMDQRKRIP